MSVHAIHSTLTGYDERQIWFDGCPECEERGSHVPESIGNLDNLNFARAWLRMLTWCDHGDVGPISKAELPLLRFLEAVRMVQRRLDGSW